MTKRTTDKRDIGQEILDGLREFKALQRGQANLKTRTVDMPDPKAARERMGLSQPEIAERMGTTQSVIARFEGGKTSPNVRTLRRHAEATGGTIKVTIERARAALCRSDVGTRNPRREVANGRTHRRRAGCAWHTRY